MIWIDSDMFESLSVAAMRSARLRMNRDMRTSPADGSQRMLNALEPGTELPVHRHPDTSETCIVLRGAAVELLYDEAGNITHRMRMEPDSDCCGVNIPAGCWHRIISLRPGTVIFEAKDGAYSPLRQEDILSL